MRSFANPTNQSSIQLFDSYQAMNDAAKYRERLYSQNPPNSEGYSPSAMTVKTQQPPKNAIRTCPTCGCNGHCAKEEIRPAISVENDGKAAVVQYTNLYQSPEPAGERQEPIEEPHPSLRHRLYAAFAHEIFSDQARVEFAQALDSRERLTCYDLVLLLRLFVDQLQMLALVHLFRANLADFDAQWFQLVGCFRRQHFKDVFMRDFGLR
ncbi:hypothetical protein SS50377_24768 [Spironucleus salmonicida]|uniref:Uncharacterized protein n=1 Tax=Spironucleus salmonicida TaxID=348837 RepID=A0A9P8RXA3_9EUKA|nr:hypothetical protein SS50377_24768 [Spironucleus salmonicida]